jgi:hypothetical protein
MFYLGWQNKLNGNIVLVIINCNLSLMEPKSFVNNRDFNAG